MNKRPWTILFEEKIERLRQPESWFPYPLFISFMLVLHFTSHVIFTTSARMGSPAEVLEFPGAPSKASSLWFAVAPDGDEIMVTTEDRQIFRWKQNVRSVEGLGEFRAYLKTKVQEVVFSATLSKEALKHDTRAIIAADQRLKYLHIRPILYALAEAEIVNYGFETKLPSVAIKADHLQERKFH